MTTPKVTEIKHEGPSPHSPLIPINGWMPLYSGGRKRMIGKAI